MPSQISNNTDIKLFILEMLKQIDAPVDFVTLNSIVVQDGFVNGFDFMDCFYELSNSGCVDKLVDENGMEKYKITDRGIRVCASIDSPIISTVRGRATRNAMALLSFKNRKTTISSSIDKIENGKYILNCNAKDENGIILNLSLSFDSYNKADLYKENYDNNPEFIYRGILGLLSGDVNYLSDAFQDDGKKGEVD